MRVMAIWRRTDRNPRVDPAPASTGMPGRTGGRMSRLDVLWRALMAVAIVALGYSLYVWGDARLYQVQENRALDALLTRAHAAAASAPTRSPALAPAPARPAIESGGLIGRIDIARLGVSAVIRAGTDAHTLRLAVGHIPGTALPGEHGNMGLAGHRDTFFRRLRDIHAGDAIQVVTAAGHYDYRVRDTRIVDPSNVSVLDPSRDTELTLVTCYPFTWIGSAPQRFIVRAVLDDGV